MSITTRRAKSIIRQRRAANKATKASHTLRSHCLRAGLDESVAGGVAGALRSKGKAIGVTGTEARLFRRDRQGNKLWREPVRGAKRYTRDEFLAIAEAYKPVAPKYKAARETLLAY